MKQTIFGLVCMSIITFLLMMLMTVYGRNLRQTETEHTLAEAVDAAMSNLMERQAYAIEDKETFVADFLQALLVQINSTSDVKVSVLDADEEKGILSVEVTETYHHPNGSVGTVSAVRTVLFDREEEEQPVYHTVNFYTADEELYKSYTLPDNSVCPMPVPPEKEGKNFRHWRFVAGGSGRAEETSITYAEERGIKTVLASGESPYTVTEDIRLIAVFE